MSPRESIERYRSIVETAVDAILTIDETGTIDSINPAGERMFGYEASELVGRNVRMLMPEPDHSRHDAYLARHRAGGAPRIIGIGRQVTGRRRDGSTFPMHLAVGEMEVQGRRMFTGVVHDLTVRIAAEEALRDSEARYRAIIETAVDGIISISSKGVVEAFNAAAERLFGYAAAEVTGRNVSMLMPEPDHSRHDGYLDRYLAGGAPRIIGIGREVTGLRKDGSVFPMHLAVSEVRHGGERHFTGIVRDMTDLRTAEAEVARQRDAAASVVAALHDGLLVSDPEGRITEMNQAFAEMVMMSREEVLGATGPPYPWWDPGDGGDAAAAFQEIVDRGRGEFELTYVRSSGEVFPVRVTVASRRGPSGELLGYVSTYRDMGPWRAAQEGLRRSEAAQRQSEAQLAAEREAQRLKDEFLAMVSHELRTPLSAVLGYLELAITDEADDDVRDLLQIAHRNGNRLSALVADLLLVAQAGAGRLSLDRRAVDVCEVIANAVLAARPAATGKGIDLDADVPPEATFHADPGRLGQVLDNLISNAVKFTAAGGRVRVRLERDARRIRIAVRDDGPGISAEDQARLFEPFYRARSTTRDVVPGTGLGLAVVKAITEAHGGRVVIDSALGEGSEFCAEFPVEEGAPRAMSGRA